MKILAILLFFNETVFCGACCCKLNRSKVKKVTYQVEKQEEHIEVAVDSRASSTPTVLAHHENPVVLPFQVGLVTPAASAQSVESANPTPPAIAAAMVIPVLSAPQLPPREESPKEKTHREESKKLILTAGQLLTICSLKHNTNGSITAQIEIIGAQKPRINTLIRDNWRTMRLFFADQPEINIDEKITDEGRNLFVATKKMAMEKAKRKQSDKNVRIFNIYTDRIEEVD